MDERLTRALKVVAVVLTVAFVGWAVYEKFFASVAPGDMAYHAVNRAFEDGLYDRAAEEYRAALRENPDHIHALRGLARSLHLAGRHEEALVLYDEAIAIAPERPQDEGERAALAADYANRGILLDTMGRHEQALADYDTALGLDPEIASGPHWLTRFLRNQPEAPPTIADRARYLRAELAKPESERLLRVPELDQQQRSYQQ
jgi:tetratricopeptide (TPR) repeat protein